jgi:hypothetical protein
MSSGKPFYETRQTCCNSISPNGPELYFPKDMLNRALDLYVGGAYWLRLNAPKGGLSTDAQQKRKQMGTKGSLNALPKSLGALETDSPLRLLQIPPLPQTAFHF